MCFYKLKNIDENQWNIYRWENKEYSGVTWH